jgi:hypothetical protein
MKYGIVGLVSLWVGLLGPCIWAFFRLGSSGFSTGILYLIGAKEIGGLLVISLVVLLGLPQLIKRL